MTRDRYVIVFRDWQRFDRQYAVIDTQRNDTWVHQTNILERAIEVRNELNDEHEGR